MCARRVLKAGPTAETGFSSVVARRVNKQQRDVQLDTMPDRVEPCLALLQPKPPESEDWASEVKWDGYRLAVHVEPGRVRFITRGGYDWTSRFPTIAIFYAFDLLCLAGQDLRSLPLDERRATLHRLLGNQHSAIGLSEEMNAHGADFLKLACELGLEGIIAKRRNAPCRSGRGGDWLKFKCVQSETFLIVGYEPSAAALGGIGKLLLAGRRGDQLAYVGGVGTGLSQKAGAALKKQLDRLATCNPAVDLKRKGVKWTEPVSASEIAFRAWTDDGMLRHASFKGLREQADQVELPRLPPHRRRPVIARAGAVPVAAIIASIIGTEWS